MRCAAVAWVFVAGCYGEVPSSPADAHTDNGPTDAVATDADAADVGDACGDTSRDPLNCGGCGRLCTTLCTRGTCVGASDLSAGYRHTCALMSDGSVRCWGANNGGQLGLSPPDDAVHPSPLGVAGLPPARAVSAGGGHTCALSQDGAAWCLGEDLYGQLGDGRVTAVPNPTPGRVLTGVALTAMSAGLHHTCARAISGGALCWGRDQSGQLGDGTTAASQALPTDVMLPAGVTVDSLFVGLGHTCALLSTGAVACWGSNTSGQIGDGTTTDRYVPTTVLGLPTVTAISATGSHTCARTDTGAVWCWGANAYGQLGIGTTTPQMATPVLVPLTSVQVRAIAVGGRHSCALTEAGTVWCWGANDRGQLGVGGLVQRALPVAVEGISDVTLLVAGDSHTCARKADGTVKCWGANDHGQLGDRTAADSSIPVSVVW